VSAAAVERARRLVDLHRYVEAEALLRSPECAGGDGEVDALLAVCLHNQGFYDQAEKAAEDAVGKAPDHWYTLYVRSFVFSRPKLGRSRMHLAFEAIDRAIGLRPGLPMLHLRKAALLRAAGRRGSALKSVETARSLAPANPAVLVRLGDALVACGRRCEARAALDEAMGISPEECLAHPVFAWTLLRLGERDRAAGFFEQALARNPAAAWAQAGALECAKRRYAVYRWAAQVGDWFYILSRPVRILVLVGLVLAVGIVCDLAAAALRHALPTAKIVARSLSLFLPLALVLLRFRNPIFNWLVRKSKAGRSTYALDLRRRQLWLACAAGYILSLLARDPLAAFFGTAVYVVAGLIPGAAAICAAGLASTPRRRLIGRVWGGFWAFLLPLMEFDAHEYSHQSDVLTGIFQAACVVGPAAFMVARWHRLDRAGAHQQAVRRKTSELA
jgi:tetratricopeptide (TPR) repeat protein